MEVETRKVFVRGDMDKAKSMVQVINRQLMQLKTAMSFADLKQYSSVWEYADGTAVRCVGVFGQFFVDVFCPQEVIKVGNVVSANPVVEVVSEELLNGFAIVYIINYAEYVVDGNLSVATYSDRFAPKTSYTITNSSSGILGVSWSKSLEACVFVQYANSSGLNVIKVIDNKGKVIRNQNIYGGYFLGNISVKDDWHYMIGWGAYRPSVLLKVNVDTGATEYTYLTLPKPNYPYVSQNEIFVQFATRLSDGTVVYCTEFVIESGGVRTWNNEFTYKYLDGTIVVVPIYSYVEGNVTDRLTVTSIVECGDRLAYVATIGRYGGPEYSSCELRLCNIYTPDDYTVLVVADHIEITASHLAGDVDIIANQLVNLYYSDVLEVLFIQQLVAMEYEYDYVWDGDFIGWIGTNRHLVINYGYIAKVDLDGTVTKLAENLNSSQYYWFTDTVVEI